MGMYDTVMVKCPNCGTKEAFQSKSGECFLDVYDLENCPDDVLWDVNRHSPYECNNCGILFQVDLETRTSKPMKPIRVQRKRTKGWKMPENTVSVTRPGIFGNPFTVKEAQEAGYEDGRKMAVFGFSEWLSDDPNDFNHLLPRERKRLLENLHKLKGKNLACFCPLDKPCHADILLELANK